MKRTQKEDLKKRKSEDRSMIKPIVTDVFFLGQKSEQAAKQDLPVGQDLQDTLQANRERCVGMAANMIGVKKQLEEAPAEILRMDSPDHPA